LESALHPMLEQGVDTIVLGCTHYPFVIPLIRKIVGHEVRVIDPAPAVARQVIRLLESHDQRNIQNVSGKLNFITTGEVKEFRKLMPGLFGEKGEVSKAFWEKNEIYQ
jgi:glutamate racemase